MAIATIVARIVLGLLFVVAGALPFFIPGPPPQPGLAGTFNQVFFASHWVWFVAAVQLIIGILLLVNRYVPLALVLLGAFLYNSFAFHITIAPAALPAPIIVLALGLLVARPHRAFFARLFQPVDVAQ